MSAFFLSIGVLFPCPPTQLPHAHTRTLTAITVITYAYECKASLKRSKRDAANRLVNVDGVDYTWDANPLRYAARTSPPRSARGLRGKLLSDGVRTFTYDAANRLTSVTSGTLTTTFEYDGSGNRTAQTVGEVTTEYVLDVAGGLPEVIVATTGGASTRYVQVQGQILAQQDSGAWTHTLPDHLGSVRQLVGSDSQVDLAQSYDPFGVLFETSGSGVSDFGYTGEWYESYTNLTFLRARYYDPSVGRFLTKDPWLGDILRPLTLNGWSYVENNSVNFVDPSGYIKEGEAAEANDVVLRLTTMYQAVVVKDWGFVNVSGIPPWGIPPTCRWEEGNWTLDELKTLEAGVTNLANAMGGANTFISNIGGVNVEQGYLLMARGKTMRHRIRFTDSPTSIDEWTVIHELGHAWDANFGWWLSKGLEEFTGGYTNWINARINQLFGNCYGERTSPGCNRTGYFYEDKPPAGSDRLFNRKEDFAEAVVGYVHPDWVQARAADFGLPYLFYENYRETPRWSYIDGLIKGTITAR